ncbi:hypothetical protein VFPPC_18087 [Pochonia chlamydosporia 170]|uniref:Uncharacterized protein n=1 Tax=Pochonia chlamydosporia 170 TaxID=1380566 RepID=A0A219AQT3_METCM|nr:hypothetical protein VFPPC_18087 [Pochonia chlamydosporia 170]OWT42674.1 hypothetical protein VFPPC_18087 [Pochonia chlamydosporia 170]
MVSHKSSEAMDPSDRFACLISLSYLFHTLSLLFTCRGSFRRFSRGICQHSSGQYDRLESSALRIWNLYVFGTGLVGLSRHLYDLSASALAGGTSRLRVLWFLCHCSATV